MGAGWLVVYDLDGDRLAKVQDVLGPAREIFRQDFRTRFLARFPNEPEVIILVSSEGEENRCRTIGSRAASCCSIFLPTTSRTSRAAPMVREIEGGLGFGRREISQCEACAGTDRSEGKSLARRHPRSGSRGSF